MKKILIYRNCSLGDFIVSLPAIKMIKNQNPNSKIYLASQKKKDVGYVKPNLIPLKKKIIDKYIFFEHNFFSFIKFLKIIKRNKFDKIYYLNGFWSNSFLYKLISSMRLKRDFLIFWLVGIKEKYGFELKKYNYDIFNETYYLCKRVNDKVKKNDISLTNLIKKNINNKQKKFITISLGGRNPKKIWKIDYWEILIKAISKSFPYLSIKIIGSKNEIDSAERIRKINKIKIINMCGKTNISALFNIISFSKYHISHDDGTMHIASCFQKYGVAIFGKVAEKGKWFPSNSNQKIFFPKLNVNDTKPNRVFKVVFKDLQKLINR